MYGLNNEIEFKKYLFMDSLSGVTPIGQGWTNVRGLRGPKPGPKKLTFPPRYAHSDVNSKMNSNHRALCWMF